MHTESIIKLIGHRPVYRVERNPAPGFQVFEDRFGSPAHGAPVIDRQDWQRPTDGWGEREFPEGGY